MQNLAKKLPLLVQQEQVKQQLPTLLIVSMKLTQERLLMMELILKILKKMTLENQ